MSIQWYPGHMTKARRELAEAIPRHDVVIEVLDARAPRASANPVLNELRGHKPCLKVLSKGDLADPKLTEAWLAMFEARGSETPPAKRGGPPPGRVLAVAVSTERPNDTKKKISELCRLLAPNRGGPGKPVRAMIAGIPNVGKSTLINTLVGRRAAKVGDEPAVTKAQQKLVTEGMVISDSPGIMWPNIEDPNVGSRLALLGSIPDSAIDYESVALFGAKILGARYADRLMARYKLTELPEAPDQILAAIGRKRGCLRSGGHIDLHKAADILIHDFRSGALGRITLDFPGSPTPTPP